MTHERWQSYLGEENSAMRFHELIQKLGTAARCNSLNVNGVDPEITGVTPIDAALPQTISYIEGGKFASYITTTEASALILPLDEALQIQASERQIAWMAASKPRLLFAQTIAVFYRPFRPKPGIHPTAVIAPTVSIGENVSIGAHVVIEEQVTIGEGVCIYPHVVIYPGVEIGEQSILHANCTIHERTVIGKNCVIHSGAVIGAEGFGFVPTPTGWFKMEQAGRTVLEDGVEVGCQTAIDRPAVGETRIGANTKLDNLVQIGHGCRIGQNCALAGQVGLAGGVTVGNQVILAGQVGIANQANIGDGVIASAKAGIHNDVPSQSIVSGIPALPHKLFLKVAATYRRLPEIYQSVKQLERSLKEKS